MDNIIVSNSIKNKIYNIRGKQVMLDRDLAELYGVETKQLNRVVKRNKKRFPEEFCFQLSKEEYKTISTSLRCQFGTIENLRGRHVKYNPFAFTEQGVSMLSALLKSDTAIDISIKIIKAFVAMRHFLIKNAEVFMRLDKVERKQIEYDDNFNQIFNAIESKQLTPNQGIFYDGQVFDAYKFVCDLIKQASKSIILIDNFIDESVLVLLSKKKEDVKVTIYTYEVSEQLNLDIHKFNKQYGNMEIKEFKKSHDRFLIIDEKTYHIGASLKDLGKKWFAFSKLELNILDNLKK
jgi:phage regulator Rha-like protein